LRICPYSRCASIISDFSLRSRDSFGCSISDFFDWDAAECGCASCTCGMQRRESPEVKRGKVLGLYSRLTILYFLYIGFSMKRLKVKTTWNEDEDEQLRFFAGLSYSERLRYFFKLRNATNFHKQSDPKGRIFKITHSHDES